MSKFLIGCGIFLAIVLFIALSVGGWMVGKYNGLVGLRVTTQTMQAQVESQLQRRFDLIPNLEAAVRGEMVNEQTVFKDIADARTKYAGAAPGSSDKIDAGNQYESAIGRLLVVMENYPDLKSVQVVKDLMTELEGTENRISVARQRYNESAQTYNTTLQSFPTNVIGGMFGFKDAVFFKGVAGSESAPKINLTK
jgi:LemA protein